MKKLPQSGSRLQMNKIYQLLRNDETLLRLLYYKEDPLSEEKPNITDLPLAEFEELSTDLVRYKEKTGEIENQVIARLNIFSIRRRQLFSNPYYAKYQFAISIIVHENLVTDLRIEQIGDRVNQILLHNNISGLSKIQYVGGDTLKAPREFQIYQHKYFFISTNKVWC